MPGPRLGRVPTVVLAVLVPVVALVTVVVTLDVTSDDTVAAPRGGSGGGDAITISNFRFSPDPLVVTAGSTVTVTNRDATVHTVTADDKSFDTGDLGGGQRTTITLDRPGRYSYVCDIHNYMTVTIEVR